MPRLRNTASGVVVNVDDDTASRLWGEWVPADGDAPARTSEATEDTSGEPKGNASRAEWAAYADSLGVEYPEDAKRDDIKAAVEAHVAEGEPEQGEPTGGGSDIW